MDDFEARLKSLMLSGLDGDASAHRQLLTLLSERLRAYFSQRMSSTRDDVEDLVQETLLAVHLRGASYDRAQPFTAWAYAIARYKLIDYWRRRRIRVATPLDDVEDFLSAEPARSDEGLDITRALGSLPARQRGLIEDVKIRGFSLSEAGARAGVSEGAAKVALHRALRMLAGRMRRADA
ncbi:sigma-70 family RNA polymerase sigma factor [Phenylobacterium sp.]|uniref:sigma-70 family RNA polymerase sigma factor n=1 Tax=Phenylobacterium sp. TaxID=1871053 RepID=UPI002F417049